MAYPSASLLLVDVDGGLDSLLERDATARGYRITSAASPADALAAVRSEVFDAVVVDAGAEADAALDALGQLKELSPDTEMIIVSSSTSVASAIRSYELSAFAVVQKPAAPGVLCATIERALERRRIALHNRRLFWELQTANEIARDISRSLELENVLTGALQRIIGAFDAVGGAICLRDELTGRYETRAAVGSATMHRLCNSAGAALKRPSDEVIATGSSVIVDDLTVASPGDTELPVRSAMSVPMVAGAQLLGTLSIGAAAPGRFDVADERLLAIIAAQIMIAVQNARLHDSIRRGKREWERTFDAISDPIAVFDSRGVLLRGNTALAALLGRSIREIRHVTCQDVGFCGGGCPSCAVGRALMRDVAGRSEITRANQQIFSVTTFPVGGADGVSVVQVAKNVTEEIRSARRLQQMSDELALTNGQLVAALDQLKSTQAQLLQAEKLSAIGQLVAGVAHELNNPLTSVIGYAQLLEEELVDVRRPENLRPGPEIAQDLRRIAEESERAARIVRNLLAFARRQSAERAPQDLTELAGRVLSLRSYEFRQNDIELCTDFPSGLPPVVADASQLQQALLNLILNAEQAMRAAPARRLTVGARFDEIAAAVELFVTDTGNGIDHSNLSRIFDPFFTTREVGEGTGLGLSICYGIIRDHGGEIAVDSRVQMGTTFSLRLPARVGRRRPGQEEILVALADQSEREFITAALVGWGYAAVPVNRVVDALGRYRRGALAAMLIDRALLAPDLDGWRAARAAQRPALPLLFLAMMGNDDEIERFGREQAGATLAPPYQLRALRAALRALVKEKAYV